MKRFILCLCAITVLFELSACGDTAENRGTSFVPSDNETSVSSADNSSASETSDPTSEDHEVQMK